MGKVWDSLSRVVRGRYFLLGVRLVLGATFILAAAAKMPERAKFVEVVTGLGLLPWDMAEAYGSILPWLELVVGSCLVAGLFSRVVAGTSILMVISFLVANGTGVYKYSGGLCAACFGILIPVKTSDALLIDVVMMAMSVLLLLYGGGFLSLDGLLSATPLRKLAFFSRSGVKG